MLCPLAPCSSRAKETTVSSPVSNGQPILFLLGISLLWLQLYMYVTKLVIFFFNYFWVALYWFLFFFGAFVVFVHISRLLGWFMPSVFFCCFCCCWNYVPFFLQVLLVVVWFMTIRFLYVLVGPVYLSQVWYAISWVILGTLSISSVSCVLFFAI